MCIYKMLKMYPISQIYKIEPFYSKDPHIIITLWR